MTCTDCAKPVQARGLCAAHYAKWRRSLPDNCPCCGSSLATSPASNGRTHDSCLSARRQSWAGYRDRIIAAYGGACTCCGESTPEFLTIDHVNGDGNRHRSELGGGNRRVLLDIINRGFPPDFTVLCFNCNCGRARDNGVCPHAKALYEAVMA